MLELLDEAYLVVNYHKYGLYACECGRTTIRRNDHVKRGAVQSCGCIRPMRMHGLSKHPTYIIYGNIKNRCYNERNPRYKDYGKRGIKLCDEWLNSPELFCDWSLENGWEKGLTIDRIDNDRGYTPENCHFVTQAENSRNTRISKITTQDLGDIKKRLLKGEKQKHIAKDYNVNSSRISSINRTIKENADE